MVSECCNRIFIGARAFQFYNEIFFFLLFSARGTLSGIFIRRAVGL